MSNADIKKLYRLTGVDNKPTVFLFNDTQLVDESFLEDINNILSSGEVPNLFKSDEFDEVCLLLIKLTSVFVCLWVRPLIVLLYFSCADPECSL